MKKIWIKLACLFIPSSKHRKAFRQRFKPSPFSYIDYAFKTNNENPLIIDCGANVGESVRFFHSMHPDARIIAYEPDRAIFENELIPNIERIADVQGRPPNITCHNKAIWVHTNGINFYPQGKLCGTCMKTNDSKVNLSPIFVKSERLYDVLRESEIIDFLKIDIEGAEIPVFLDCQELIYKADRIFLEYHSFVEKRQELSKILRILEENNFRYRIAEDYNPSGQYWHYADNGNGMDCQLKIFAVNSRIIPKTPPTDL